LLSLPPPHPFAAALLDFAKLGVSKRMLACQ